jgi:hypothetical protein
MNRSPIPRPRIQASEASRGWQAAAYDECYAKPRLDPPAPVPLPSCYPLLYPAATPREPPLPMSLCHCFVYFQVLLLPHNRAGAEPGHCDG